MKTYVISGFSCAGKTTTVEQLENMGHRVIPETAMPVNLQTDDQTARQNIMLYNQLQVEDRLNRQRGYDHIFLDRALPDYIAFTKALGIVPDQRLMGLCDRRATNYDLVFFLEKVQPYDFTEFRIELGEEGVTQLGNAVLKEYQERGIPVIRVPPGSLVTRVQFIQDVVRGRVKW